ncbi:unnamed protein product [Didymodactylos carnosus]|uniref:C2H2-type domain-containing protein n=1 Tax=Didymodactylos carnosus TaxID=1234261 RepID=A0A8S2DI91_9BILA|nr:unnamed protein product [Didymodactylos carnosus]CAF3711115.1 unnamed protein product [Didymodactylos carnosus]
MSGINVTDFVCPSCTNWSTPYLKKFVNHLKNTHCTNKNITIMCNLCNSVSSNARAFSQHVSKYHRTQDKAVKEDDELQILEESIGQAQPVVINTNMNGDDYMVTEEETSEEQLPTTLTEMNSFIKRILHFLLTLQSCFYISEAAVRYVATNLADLLEWLLVHPDVLLSNDEYHTVKWSYIPFLDNLRHFLQLSEVQVDLSADDFLDGIKQLSAAGIRVNVNGVEKIYHGALFITLGDYPAQQAIHGRKESVAAKRFCPCCDITSDNFAVFIDQDYNADGTLSTNIFKHNIMLQYVTTIPDGLILDIEQLLLPSPPTSIAQIAKIDSISYTVGAILCVSSVYLSFKPQFVQIKNILLIGHQPIFMVQYVKVIKYDPHVKAFEVKMKQELGTVSKQDLKSCLKTRAASVRIRIIVLVTLMTIAVTISVYLSSTSATMFNTSPLPFIKSSPSTPQTLFNPTVAPSTEPVSPSYPSRLLESDQHSSSIACPLSTVASDKTPLRPRKNRIKAKIQESNVHVPSTCQLPVYTETVEQALLGGIQMKRKQGLLTKRKKKQRKASVVIDIKELKKIESYETDTDEKKEMDEENNIIPLHYGNEVTVVTTRESPTSSKVLAVDTDEHVELFKTDMEESPMSDEKQYEVSVSATSLLLTTEERQRDYNSIQEDSKEQFYKNITDKVKSMAARAAVLTDDDTAIVGDNDSSSCHSIGGSQIPVQQPKVQQSQSALFICKQNNKVFRLPIMLSYSRALQSQQTQLTPASSFTPRCSIASKSIHSQPSLNTCTTPKDNSSAASSNDSTIDQTYSSLKSELCTRVSRISKKKKANVEPSVMMHIKQLQETTFLMRRKQMSKHLLLPINDKAQLYPELLNEQMLLSEWNLLLRTNKTKEKKPKISTIIDKQFNPNTLRFGVFWSGAIWDKGTINLSSTVKFNIMSTASGLQGPLFLFLITFPVYDIDFPADIKLAVDQLIEQVLDISQY